MMSQTILIVEADQPTRELYERELGADYTVLACPDDRDILGAINAHHVSALILEPSLPAGRGWALLQQIRSSADLHALPVILCSTQNAQRRAAALGATMYLVKPVLPAKLLEALRQVLAP